MEILVLLLLIVGGLILCLVEVLLIPGFSLAGAAGALCLIAADVYAFLSLGTVAGVAMLAATLLLGAGGFWWVMHSKSIDRMALKKEIDSSVATPARRLVKPGDSGRAITRLALIGNALIGGEVIEVKSCDGFIDEGTPVSVERISEGVIMVKRNNN